MSSASSSWSISPEAIFAPLFALAAVSGLERLVTIESPHLANIFRDPAPPDSAPL